MSDIVVDPDISLRPYTPEHAELLSPLLEANRAYLEPWVRLPGLVADVESYRNVLSELQERQSRGEVGGGSIVYRGELVGDVNFDGGFWASTGHAVGISYWITEKFQGRGIVTRACERVVTLAFETPGIAKVELSAAAHNKRSRRIIERLGFRLDGVLRSELKRRDDLHDLAVYSMLRPEWLAR
ncbi:MAG: GNAT family protein [Dehalococcoidia bacterium]|jgi:ribosomal-protein-serine acetyltransferase|nr:GNAT family protein [Dehalococcoidia bacterium]